METKFKHNIELDAMRKKYSDEYDENFKKIQSSIKKSPDHLTYIKIEKILEIRTHKFLKENRGYFGAMRKFYVRKGIMNRPQFRPMDKEEKLIFKGE